MSITPTPETPREARVAELAGALWWVNNGSSSAGRWLLTTVEALAGLDSQTYCPECTWDSTHNPTCTVGICAGAWRRFTQKGEMDD